MISNADIVHWMSYTKHIICLLACLNPEFNESVRMSVCAPFVLAFSVCVCVLIAIIVFQLSHFVFFSHLHFIFIHLPHFVGPPPLSLYFIIIIYIFVYSLLHSFCIFFFLPFLRGSTLLILPSFSFFSYFYFYLTLIFFHTFFFSLCSLCMCVLCVRVYVCIRFNVISTLP